MRRQDAEVTGDVASWRRNDGGKAGDEGMSSKDDSVGAVRPRTLEVELHFAIWQGVQTVIGEGRAQDVATKMLATLFVVGVHVRVVSNAKLSWRRTASLTKSSIIRPARNATRSGAKRDRPAAIRSALMKEGQLASWVRYWRANVVLPATLGACQNVDAGYSSCHLFRFPRPQHPQGAVRTAWFSRRFSAQCSRA